MTANCRGDHTRTSWAPAVKAILRLYRTRRARAKGLQGRPRGQPGKAVGHAVGKLTLRDDLGEVGEGHGEIACALAGYDQC